MTKMRVLLASAGIMAAAVGCTPIQTQAVLDTATPVIEAEADAALGIVRNALCRMPVSQAGRASADRDDALALYYGCQSIRDLFRNVAVALGSREIEVTLDVTFPE